MDMFRSGKVTEPEYVGDHGVEAPEDGFYGTHFPDGRIKDLFLVKDGDTFQRDWDNDRWDFASLPTDEEVWTLSRKEAYRLYKDAPPLPPM